MYSVCWLLKMYQHGMKLCRNVPWPSRSLSAKFHHILIHFEQSTNTRHLYPENIKSVELNVVPQYGKILDQNRPIFGQFLTILIFSKMHRCGRFFDLLGHIIQGVFLELSQWKHGRYRSFWRLFQVWQCPWIPQVSENTINNVKTVLLTNFVCLEKNRKKFIF